MNYCCKVNIINQLEEPAFTDQERDDYITMVFLGLITTTSLSLSYDFRIKEILRRALIEGYGDTLSDLQPGSPEYILLTEFENNISKFSAAKQYQQVRDMEAFLGISIEEFREQANAIFAEYNQNWLNTEFETVVNASRSGRRWIDFEKNKSIRPFLTYNTQQDDRVRPAHEILQGITRPVDDPFWDSYAPPNGWNCRCFLTSSSKKKITRNIPVDTFEKVIPDTFKFNPGKTGLLFSNLHPYFDVRRQDNILRKRNFNLPI